MAGAEGAQGWWLDNTGGLKRSLRFNSTDSAYLSRTPASAGNRQLWTWSGWIKRVKFDVNSIIYSAVQDGNNGTVFYFDVNNCLSFFNYISGGYSGRRITTPVYRDPSAWYHIVLVWDSANATVSNRIRIYANGTEVTTFSTSTDPNSANSIVNSTNAHYIGADVGFNNQYSNLYLADIHFIDGQALDPTSFGEFDSNGVWNPKTYLGTYGTNGFHLPFTDNSTASALGTDVSGNDNDWTVNNISVTAGAGNDSLLDFPINYGEDTGRGGEVRGNYATLNPLDPLTYGSMTLSNGNLNFAGGANYFANRSTIYFPPTGKWYAEFSFLTLTSATSVVGLHGSGGYLSWYSNNGRVTYTGGEINAGSFTVNDVLGIAVDVSVNETILYKNGALVGTVTGATFDLSRMGYLVQTYNSSGWVNFGQRPFAYTAPSGYKALCTNNLPEPTIEDGSQYMDVKLYTGNGSTQTISGLGFSPDLVWIKERSSTSGHGLFDIVRGTGLRLRSDGTFAETSGGAVTAFNIDGFNLNSDTAANELNQTYAAWTWDAGSSTVTNTDGSITSSVRANPSAGFSIITFTGNETVGATVGHGLGAKPGFAIFKDRNSGTRNFIVYHQSIGAGKFLMLNRANAQGTSTIMFNNTEPTSSVFSLANNSETNSTNSMICWAWAPVAGYSSFGSYVGNGSAVFVYTGFAPRWVLIKRSDSATEGSWWILDSAREPYNYKNTKLFANLNDNETFYQTPSEVVDFLSNGFMVRSTAFANVNGGTHIYAAFAEHPFRTSRAR